MEYVRNGAKQSRVSVSCPALLCSAPDCTALPPPSESGPRSTLFVTWRAKEVGIIGTVGR